MDHGGFIKVGSSKGSGARFDIYIPSSLEKIEESVLSPDADLDLQGNETVIVIDDEETNCQAAQAILSEYGYNALTAAGGLEGLDLFRQEKERIGLAIVDLVMPEVGGDEVCREIRRMYPKVPVILCSGYSTTGIPDDLICDKVSFLSKPLQTKSLLISIRKALDAPKGLESEISE